MTSRRIALAAVVAALATVAVGCGDEPSSQGAAHVESNAAHARATQEEAADGSAIVRTVGTKLYAPLAKEAGDHNLAFSPLSIVTALGMTRAGADGTSATQLDELFGSTPANGLHRAINGADETVSSLAGPVQLADGKTMDEIDISTANSLWGQSGVTFEKPFLDELRSSYDASMWTADYANDPERARADINDWVKSHTGEKIAELLPKGSIDDLTRLVLANALYFKAPWPERIDDYPNAPFTTAAGKTVKAPMLGLTEERAYAKGDGWQSVTIPYAGNKLGFTLLVPDEGKLDDVEAALDPKLLLDATTGELTLVDLRFPKFDIKTEASLAPALQSLGVKAPFEKGTDDFLPMTKDPNAQPLYLKDMLHQATVAVDENGTEAAAATAAVFDAVGAPIGPVELKVDRPFLFVVHDLETSTPLFIGRIADPTAG